MKLSIESTEELLELDGVQVRRWKGVTASGLECHVFVREIEVLSAERQAEFDALSVVRIEPYLGEPTRIYETFHAGEAYYVKREAPTQVRITRTLFGRVLGTIDLGPVPERASGVRISPRGDIPFRVVEQLRRLTAAEIQERTGIPASTQVTPADPEVVL